MGKPVATYLVKVTLRKPPDVMDEPEPPTNDELAAAIKAGIEDHEGSAFEVNATSERTDI